MPPGCFWAKVFRQGESLPAAQVTFQRESIVNPFAARAGLGESAAAFPATHRTWTQQPMTSPGSNRGREREESALPGLPLS
jgi:hypothetical protein